MSSGGEGACQLPFGTKIRSLSLPGVIRRWEITGIIRNRESEMTEPH